MDQARDPVTGRPAAPPTDATRASDDPGAIADDIRETRAELDETVEAIGARLDPNRLMDDAKDALTSKAHDLVDRASDAVSDGGGGSLMDSFGSNDLVETVKRNPMPALAVGLSVAWFFSKLGESESSRYRRERYGDYDPYDDRRRLYDADDRYGDRSGRPSLTAGSGSVSSGPTGSDDESLADKASDAFDAATDKVSDAASAATSKAAGLADQAGDAASDLADRTSDATDRAGDRARGAGQSARRAGLRAESWLERQGNQNPLAVGAVALAAGALVGLSVPETDAEHELMGDQADQLKRQAAQVARDKADDLSDKAQDVANEAESKAKDIADQARRKAEEVADQAEDKADEVASKAKSSSGSGTPPTGTSVDLSTGATTPGAGSTRPPAADLGSKTPSTTVDLEGTPGGSPSSPSKTTGGGSA